MAKKKKSRDNGHDDPVQETAETAREAELVSATELISEKQGSPAAMVREMLSQDELLPAALGRILEERARDLARVPPAEEEGTVVQVVTFALGEETYAVEVAYVDEINPLGELTPLPCTPDFCVGVINLRGRILSILDIHKFLGLGGISATNGTQVIAVSAAGLEVGLLVDQVHTVRPLILDELDPVLPTTARIAAEYTRGVTSDMVVLLDLEALLKDERVIVWEEVG